MHNWVLWQWVVFLLVELSIGFCYISYPAKLKKLIEQSNQDTSSLLYNYNLKFAGTFIVFCGLFSHIFMVPLMYFSDSLLGYWIFIATNISVLVVSLGAIFMFREELK